jgi:hypothetical protein
MFAGLEVSEVAPVDLKGNVQREAGIVAVSPATFEIKNDTVSLVISDHFVGIESGCMAVFEFNASRNCKLGQGQSVTTKKALFGRNSSPTVLEDEFSVLCNEFGFGKLPQCAMSEACLEPSLIAPVKKVKRAAAWVLGFVGKRYSQMATGFGVHLKRLEMPVEF